MTEDPLEARYNIRPHFEKLVRSHGLRRWARRLSTAFFVLFIETGIVPDVDSPVRGVPLLEKVMTPLSKHPADVFCQLFVRIRSPGEDMNRCSR
jgi:hypothetical protein